MFGADFAQWRKPGGWLDFFFPPLCLGCGCYSESPDFICERCRNRIDVFVHPICLTCGQMIDHGHRCDLCREDALMLFAHGNYRDPLKEIIIQFKFKGITSPAESVAEAVAERFGERLALFGETRLIPIPLYPSREYARGYNQALLFADALSRRLQVPRDDEILYRVMRRHPQAKLHHDDRARNIKGVFEAEKALTKEQHVILVDDVVTTGATVAEARRVLIAAGYQVPAVIAMAHGL